MFRCRNRTRSLIVISRAILEKDTPVQDLRARYEKVTADAAECELIKSLATDPEKRKMFSDLAEQYRRMAEALKQEIRRREAA
jgi:hypothetical protein